MGLTFFKGDSKDVLEDLRRFIDSHFRGYVYNRLLSTYGGEGELTNVIVNAIVKGSLTPYDLIVINRGLTYDDLVKLVDDPVTRRYIQYIKILDKMIESYDGEETVRVKTGYSETIVGYEAVLNNVNDVVVYAVILNLENHTVKRVELTELLEDC